MSRRSPMLGTAPAAEDLNVAIPPGPLRVRSSASVVAMSCARSESSACRCAAHRLTSAPPATTGWNAARTGLERKAPALSATSATAPATSMPKVTGVREAPFSLTAWTPIRYVCMPAAGSCRQGEPESVRKSPTAIGADGVAFTLTAKSGLFAAPFRATTAAAPGATHGTVNCTPPAPACVTTARTPFT